MGEKRALASACGGKRGQNSIISHIGKKKKTELKMCTTVMGPSSFRWRKQGILHIIVHELFLLAFVSKGPMSSLCVTFLFIIVTAVGHFVRCMEMQGQLISVHGMLAILEVLEGWGSDEVITWLLQIINLVSAFQVPFDLSDESRLLIHLGLD